MLIEKQAHAAIMNDACSLRFISLEEQVFVSDTTSIDTHSDDVKCVDSGLGYIEPNLNINPIYMFL